MKKLLQQLLITLVFLIFPLLNVQAATYSILPDDKFDIAGQSQVRFDLYLVTEQEEDITSLIGAELEFTFDDSELSLATYQSGDTELYNITFYLSGFGSLYPLNASGSIDSGSFTISYGTLSAVNIFGSTSTLLASFVFDIMDEQAFDGNPDFELLSQTEYMGLMLSDYSFLQYDATAGADIGTPVPTPSSILLLAGGLCALLGTARRKS